MKHHIALALAFALFFLSPIPFSQKNTPSSLDGRWMLTIEDDARRIEMPVDLRVAANGQARLVLLGKTDGEDGLFTGAVADGQLLLDGRFARSRAEMKLMVNGERASGRLTGDLVQAEIYGMRAPVGEAEVPVNRYELLMGAILNGLQQNFYDPKLNGIEPSALRARHLPRVKAARNDGELALAIRQMLAELRVSHTEFFLATDKPPVVYKSEAVVWRQLEPGIGYLALLNLAQDNLRNFDGLLSIAMSDVGKHPALIVDLRGNRGERLEAALAALNLLLPEKRPVAYFATREAMIRMKVASIDHINPATLPIADADDQRATARFQGAGMYQAGGKFRTPYRGRIVLLVDGGCVGACELLAAAMQEARAATLIGRPTRGALLLSKPVSFKIIGWIGVPRNQVRGWQLEAPTTEIRTAGGVKIEGRGVIPDVAVERSAAEDADLAQALRWLSQSK